MKVIYLVLFGVISASAAITNVQVTDRLSTEVVLRFTASSQTACKIEVSESPTYSPLIHDVNATLFSGSNSDSRSTLHSGRGRVVVIGHGGQGETGKYAHLAADGKRYSRALSPHTRYYYRINGDTACDAAAVTGEFWTANLPTGVTRADNPLPIDPAVPGEVAYPTVDFTSQTAVYNDLKSGVKLQLLGPANQARKVNVPSYSVYDFASPVYQGTGWTTPQNALVSDGSLADSSGTNPIALISSTAITTTRDAIGVRIDVQGYVDNGLTGNDAQTELCMVVNGVSCYGPWLAVTLPVQSSYSGQYTSLGDIDTSGGTPYTQPNYPVFGTGAGPQTWLNPGQLIPAQSRLQPRSGTADATGADVTLNWVGTTAFEATLAAGSHIIYNSVDRTLASSAGDGVHLTLTESVGPLTQVAWTGRWFGFLLRKKTTTGAAHIDHVRFKFMIYEPTVTNGGSAAHRQCTQSRYPEGWRITNATNATPIVLTVLGPDVTTQVAVNDQVTVFGVPGNTAANGTWTVSARTATTITLSGSAGNDTYTTYSAYVESGSVVKVGARTGHLCQVSSASGPPFLYWIDPDNPARTNAEIRSLGPFDVQHNLSGCDTGGNAFGVNYAWDESDPNTPTTYKTMTCSSEVEMVEGRYIGNPDTSFGNGGRFRDIGYDYSSGGPSVDPIIWGWKKITNGPSDSFQDRVLAFDPDFPTALGFAMQGVVANCKISFGGRFAQQNTEGVFGVYDVCTGQVVATMNTWGQNNMRGCAEHTSHQSYATGIMLIAGYVLNAPGEAYRGPYFATTTTSMPVASGGDPWVGFSNCTTELTAIGLGGNAAIYGLDGVPRCTTVTLGSKNMTNGPSGNPADRNLGLVKAGDVLVVNPNVHTEWMRVVGVSASTDDIVVERAKGSDKRNTAHAIGTNLNWQCTPAPQIIDSFSPGSSAFGANFIWDYGLGGNQSSADTGDPYQLNQAGARVRVEYVGSSASHTGVSKSLVTGKSYFLNDQGSAFTLTSSQYQCPVGAQSAQYVTRLGQMPAALDFASATYACTDAAPYFSGTNGRGQGNEAEKHIAMPATNPSPTQNEPSFIDARPIAANPGSGPPAGEDFSKFLITKVGGATYLYKLTKVDGSPGGPCTQNSVQCFDPKRHGLYAAVGQHPLRDVSRVGASFDLPDSPDYTYCVAVVNEDCRNGSLSGDLFFNAPAVSVLPANYRGDGGTYNGYRCADPKVGTLGEINNPCFYLMHSYAMQTVQMSTTQDPFSHGSRKITTGFYNPLREDGLWNAYLMPSGSGAFVLAVPQDQMQIIWYANLPPYQGPDHSINRGDFIPIAMPFTSVPPGTSTVLVEFGYDPSLNCLRAESCMANAATIQTGANVFKWVGEAPAGLSCAASCTVTVAALPARMMWWRKVYRNAGGTTIATSKVEVMAVP